MRIEQLLKKLQNLPGTLELFVYDEATDDALPVTDVRQQEGGVVLHTTKGEA